MDIQQLKSLKILVIGDSCTDIYNYGTCDRISPEAPVPVLRTTFKEEKPGMALNVQKNLEALGHKTMIITNPETIKKERFVDQRTMQHLLRVDSG
jgi:bifunctional ADP-heptose synthase (sugar kinase/adenylyltransferase)